MNIFINQYFGIGDIIFSMTIAKRYTEQGYKVTWGVLPQFLDGLKRAYPMITWVDWQLFPIDYNKRVEHDVLVDGVWYRVLPLRWNVEILGVPYNDCMKSKYDLVGMDWRDWREGAMWERDEKKENELYNWYNEKWTEGKEYRLLNLTYGSEGRMQIDIPIMQGDVIMHPKTKYSIFDWATVLENAKEIHTVSTSLFYLLELLDLKCPLHLYPRPTDPKFKHINYLFTKPYILH